MPFVKIDTALRRNARLLRVSRSAEVVYRRSQELAQDLADDGTRRVGFLEHHSLGSLDMTEIAVQLCLPDREVAKAAEELIAAGLWGRELTGCVFLPRFAEKTAPADATSAARQKKWRNRKSDAAGSNGESNALRNGARNGADNGAIPLRVTPQNSRSKNIEDSATTHVVTAAKARKPWEAPPMPSSLPSVLPDAIDALKAVAVEFLHAFANATSPEAVKKHSGSYVEALAIFRSRGIGTQDTWRAFCDARLARDGQPLFGGEAKKAVAFIAARPANGRSNGASRRNDEIVTVPREDEL